MNFELINLQNITRFLIKVYQQIIPVSYFVPVLYYIVIWPLNCSYNWLYCINFHSLQKKKKKKKLPTLKFNLIPRKTFCSKNQKSTAMKDMPLLYTIKNHCCNKSMFQESNM